MKGILKFFYLFIIIFLLIYSNSCSLDSMYKKYSYSLVQKGDFVNDQNIKVDVRFLSKKYLKGVYSIEPARNPFIVFDKNDKKQITFNININNKSKNKYYFFDVNRVFVVFFDKDDNILFSIKPLGYKIIRDYYFVKKDTYKFSDYKFMEFTRKLKIYFPDERKIYKIGSGANFNKYITFVFKKFYLVQYEIKKIQFAMFLKSDDGKIMKFMYKIPDKLIMDEKIPTKNEKEIEEVK